MYDVKYNEILRRKIEGCCNFNFATASFYYQKKSQCIILGK